jgi:chromosome segregation ATPase
MHTELARVDEDLAEKEKSIEKAHAIIRKLNEDYEKSIHDIQRLEGLLEKQKDEKKEMQVQVKELRNELKNADTAKRAEERLRSENQRCKEEMLELARLAKDDKERHDGEHERVQTENEEYKFIITQLQGKLGDIEKLLNDRNGALQQLEQSSTHLKAQLETVPAASKA